MRYSTQQNSLVELNTEGRSSGLDSIKSKNPKNTPQKRIKQNKPAVDVRKKLKLQIQRQRNQTAVYSSMEAPSKFDGSQVQMFLDIGQRKQESDISSPIKYKKISPDISPIRQKQRAKSSFGVRQSRNSQVNTQMDGMLQSLSQNPFFNNYLLNNDFQNMTLNSKEKLLGFQKIYNQRQFESEEPQILARKKKQKKTQSMTSKQIQELVRQNKNLSKQYSQIANKMMNFMEGGQLPNIPRDFRDQTQQHPSDGLRSNPEQSPSGLGGITNTGSLNKSANIYYNRIQNLTINARRPQDYLENFVSNNPLNQEPVSGSKPTEKGSHSPLSYNLPNIQMFSFEDEKGNLKPRGGNNTGRVKASTRKRSTNITNKAELDDMPVTHTNMSEFLNQNIQSINPSAAAESSQLRHLKEMQQKKRVSSQLLEDDVKIQKLVFAMRDELEKKKEIYGEDKLEVLQHAIQQIMGNDQQADDSSQDTLKLLKLPVSRPSIQPLDRKQEEKPKLISKLKGKQVENEKMRIEQPVHIAESLQSMFSKELPQDVEVIDQDQEAMFLQQSSKGASEVQHLQMKQDQLNFVHHQLLPQQVIYNHVDEPSNSQRNINHQNTVDIDLPKTEEVDALSREYDQSLNDYIEKVSENQESQDQYQPKTKQSPKIDTIESKGHSFRDYSESPAQVPASEEISPFKIPYTEQQSPYRESEEGPPQPEFNADERYLLGMLDFMDQEKQQLFKQDKRPFQSVQLQSQELGHQEKNFGFQHQTKKFKFSKFEPEFFKDTPAKAIMSDFDNKIVQNIGPEKIIKIDNIGFKHSHSLLPEQTPETTLSIQSIDYETSQAYLSRDHSIGVVIPDIDEFEMQECEFRLEIALTEQDDMKYPEKFKNPFKIDRKSIVIKETEDFEVYAQYVDMVWERKNNKSAFIIFDDDNYIDTNLDKMDLFDIKTNTNKQNVYDQIDWDQLEIDIERVCHKYQDPNQIDRFSPEIDRYMQITYKDIAKLRCNLCLADCLLKIPRSKMFELQGQFSNIIRLLPIVSKFKIGLFSKMMNKHSNQVCFQSRFTQIMKLYQFQEKHLKNDNYLQNIEERSHNLGLRTELKEFVSMHMIDINNRYSYYDLLFKHQTSSLYDIMFDKSQDFVLNQMFDNLYTAQKEICIQSLLKDEDGSQIEYHKIDQKHLKKIIMQKKVAKVQDHSSTQMNILDEILHDVEGFSMPTTNFHKTDRDGDLCKTQIRPFKRQNALDPCSDQTCKLQVIRQLDKILLKSKDSINMLYNKIETLINKDDQDYSNIFHLFGYKCNYIRNPDSTKYLMEVYIPILKRDGLLKIRKRKAILSKQLNKSSEITKSKYAPEYKEKEKNKLEQRFREMLMVEDYLTDDSMKEIDFKDINEDLSDEDQKPEMIKKKHEMMSNLGNFDSPMEHYHKLRMDREKSGVVSKKCSQMGFDIVNVVNSKKYKSKFSEELTDEQNQKNPLKLQRDKNKVEVMILQTQAGIIQENIDDADKIRESKSYIRKVRQEGIEHFGSVQNYNEAKQGRVLEKNLQKLEKNIEKSINELENQNFKLQEHITKESRKKSIEKMKSMADDKESRNILNKIKSEEDDKTFLVNNEISILKAIQHKKKECKHSIQKKLDARVKLLNQVNQHQKKIKEKVAIKRKDTAQVQALKQFQQQLLDMYQQKKQEASQSNTIENTENLIKPKKDSMFKISINLADTLKSDGPKLLQRPKNEPCNTQHDKLHMRFRQRMFQAIETSNVGLMKDILNRYTHQEEYNTIMDSGGNSLVCLAALHGDHEMIKVLIENGFDPNIPNNQGDTPLHHAITGEKFKCVDLLIQKGVNERIKNNQGFIPWELS